MRWRRVRAIVADDLDADAQLPQRCVVERLDVKTAYLARQEDIGGAVIRLCGLRHVDVARQPDHHVTQSSVQRIAQEAAPLRPPRVLNGGPEVAREEIGDAAFEPL